MQHGAGVSVLLAVFGLLFAGSAPAQDVDVPDALAEWRSWVLDGEEYRSCPFYFDGPADSRSQFICAWPDILELDVETGGAAFRQSWQITGSEAWLLLPGNEQYWPDNVLVNGSAMPVVFRNGIPSVRVTPGRYTVSGEFEWTTRPGVLPVPALVGHLALTVEGRVVDRPVLNATGVFLGERRPESEARDAVSVDVYRLLEDGIPGRLQTQLELDVSGSVREESIGPVLTGDWTPTNLRSSLPARLEADGSLRVQLRPGRWTITLTARAPGVVEQAGPPAETGERLPGNEVWSFRGSDNLRVTSATAAQPVDPSQTGVPQEWQQLPAFRLAAGERLLVEERSRGRTHTDNDLTLDRSLWLDFSGEGFTVLDELGGTMRSAWRLDMHPPFALQSARENGDDLLVTYGDDEGETGVELRQTDVSVEAHARIGPDRRMPVTGWDARFSSVGTTLYLPPGNKLLAAPGSDAAVGSWAGQWQLLDFFVVLLVTIAAWKLFGRGAGIVALVAIVLSFNEAGAPAWLWLNLLAAVAVLKVTPAGKLNHAVKAWLAVGALLLAFALVPFVANQLRIAIYPQLEAQLRPGMMGRSMAPLPAAVAPADDEQRMREIQELDDAAFNAAQRLQSKAQSDGLEEIVVTGAQVSSGPFARYAPNAIVQTGPGIPTWEWNRYWLTWNGPVDSDQAFRLVIVPRWLVTFLRFAEVLLLLTFAALIAAHALGRNWRLPGGLGVGPAPATTLLVLATCLPIGFGSNEARAQTPDPVLLEELKQRLTEPPDCVPRCAEISRATVNADADNLRIELVVDAIEPVAIPLPGSQEGWQAVSVLVAGENGAGLIRDPQQRFWLRVAQGRQRVVMSGPTGNADRLELRFPTPPRVITASGDAWLIEGVRDRRLLSGSLQLTRLQAEGDEGLRWEHNQFPPFVEVVRAVDLGLDWRVTTIVRRIAPVEGALTLAIPLLPGESVVTGELPVREGSVQVSMGPTQGMVSWQSTLPRTSPLTLDAPLATDRTEIWRFGIGSTWRAEFSGVPETETGDSPGAVRTALFHPRPGETLLVETSRPEAVPGETLAFDDVDLSIEQGSRTRSGTLVLSYRSTRGAQHELSLPAGAELVEVLIDGSVEPLRAKDDKLAVPIVPGEHEIIVKWRESEAASFRTMTSIVDPGAPSSNVALNLDLPSNRWLLFTTGPLLGPAVLYWAELAALVLFAWILARIGWTPLAFHHWLLLGLGFSTFNWFAFGLVVAWILVVAAREKWRIEGSPLQFNLQQVIVLVVTIAALLAIIISLPIGLLGNPDMQVTGYGPPGNGLAWFADRADGVLPVASVFSLPMWVYKTLILAWALWLSLALLKWLPWTWQCFSRDGFFRSRSGEIREQG